MAWWAWVLVSLGGITILVIAIGLLFLRQDSMNQAPPGTYWSYKGFDVGQNLSHLETKKAMDLADREEHKRTIEFLDGLGIGSARSPCDQVACVLSYAASAQNDPTEIAKCKRALGLLASVHGEKAIKEAMGAFERRWRPSARCAVDSGPTEPVHSRHRAGPAMKVIKVGGRGACCVAMTSDARYAVSGEWAYREKCDLKVWDIVQERCICKLRGHANGINAVAITHDGSRVVSGGQDFSVRVWDVAGRKCLRSLDFPVPINAVAMSDDGNTIVFGGGTIESRTEVFGAALYDKPDDWTAGQWVKDPNMQPYLSTTKCISISPDGLCGIQGGHVGLALFDRGHRDQVSFTISDRYDRQSNSFDWRYADTVVDVKLIWQERLVVACTDGALASWEFDSGRLRWEVSSPFFLCSIAATAAHGGLVVVGCGDGTVQAWSIHDGGYIGQLGAHRARGRVAVAISDSGETVFICWSGQSPLRLGPLTHHAWQTTLAG